MPERKTSIARFQAKSGKGGMPIRIGDLSSGWVHEVPQDGEGAVGEVVRVYGCSWDEAVEKLGAAYGDLNKVLSEKVREGVGYASPRAVDHPPPLIRFPYALVARFTAWQK